MAPHPLDDENVLVKVSVYHLDTNLKGESIVAAPADGSPTVAEATTQALEEAEDSLLKQLEELGGC